MDSRTVKWKCAECKTEQESTLTLQPPGSVSGPKPPPGDRSRASVQCVKCKKRQEVPLP